MLKLPPLRTESQDFLHLDLLRFLAATGIVVLHMGGRMGVAPPQGLNVMVDLFFIISGVVIYSVYADRVGTWRGYGKFLRARVARLVPLHWATLFFYAVLAVAAGMGLGASNDPSRYDWSCFADHLVLIHAFGVCRHLSFNFVSWSISAECAAYLAFPLVLFATRRWGAFALVASAAALGALFLFDGSGPMPFWDRTINLGVLRVVPGFLFGVALGQHRHLLKRLPYAEALFWACLAAFVALEVADAPKAPLLLLSYLIAALGVGADAQGRASWIVRKAAPLSQLTFSLYMLHPVVITLLITILGDRLLHLSGAPQEAMGYLAFVAVFPLAYLSLNLFETPARDLINGRTRSRIRARAIAAVSPAE